MSHPDMQAAPAPAPTPNISPDMIKIVPILATLAALPLMAQEPTETSPADATTPPTVQCRKCGNSAPGQCPQAAVAAAIGFQQGFEMGFASGLNQALRLVKAGCACCKDGKDAPRPHGGRPAGARPTPPPAAQPMPRPMPAQQAAPQPLVPNQPPAEAPEAA